MFTYHFERVGSLYETPSLNTSPCTAVQELAPGPEVISNLAGFRTLFLPNLRHFLREAFLFLCQGWVFYFFQEAGGVKTR
jgi:hypothetical protein